LKDPQININKKIDSFLHKSGKSRWASDYDYFKEECHMTELEWSQDPEDDIDFQIKHDTDEEES